MFDVYTTMASKKPVTATEIATEELATIKAQAEALGVPFVESVPQNIHRDVLTLIPEDSARKYSMIPFERKGTTLSVAMVNPQDFEALNVLRFLAEKERLGIEVYLISEKLFNEIAKNYTGTEKVLKEAIQSLKEEEIDIAARKELVTKSAADQDIFQDAPIAKLVEVVVKHALDSRASDIHVEPIEGAFEYVIG